MENYDGKVFPAIQGININNYKAREYLCVYDRKAELATRLKYLAIGLRLFDAYGLSPDLFVAFHFTRHKRVNRFVYCINALLIMLGCFSIYQSRFWDGLFAGKWTITYLTLGVSICFLSVIFWSFMRIIRKNFIHTTRALTTSQYIVQLQNATVGDPLIFEKLGREILKGDFHKYGIEQTTGGVASKIETGELESNQNLSLIDLQRDQEDTVTSSTPDDVKIEAKEGMESDQADNAATRKLFSDVDHQLSNDIVVADNPGSIDAKGTAVYSDSEFQLELFEISQQKNQFNGMPMPKVIDYFGVMCCSACKNDIPQMAKRDFTRFLKMAFLGEVKGEKIKLDRFKVGVTQDVFHRFMQETSNELYENKDRERYLRLLTDHFDGFDFDTILKNFRSNKKSCLPEVRKRYKNDIQNLQPVQK
ncbi:hypothetical protein DYBT9623_05233 [Dyadobacter sp. CECT 9623]|uniref:Uncharacterized protein n=1 Tax=Dyadobacter linearis TaxID=2823330 RepID=A0ABN7REJ7_9BACT|nr:hypothetical protein [Dyadobacter sp. CECT 9623]CAG5074546.1 hypothetical protein DYBT9623_05233 [Dyadobacter sp. CECT 9623]